MDKDFLELYFKELNSLAIATNLIVGYTTYAVVANDSCTLYTKAVLGLGTPPPPPDSDLSKN